MDSTIIIEKSIIILAVFAITMLMAMYSTLAERKVAAWIQDRIGPNRAGKGGLLQPLADGLKLFSKEEFEPDTPNRFLFFVGPAIAMSTALMTSAVIPWGDKLHIFGRDVLSRIISYHLQEVVIIHPILRGLAPHDLVEKPQLYVQPK